MASAWPRGWRNAGLLAAGAGALLLKFGKGLLAFRLLRRFISKPVLHGVRGTFATLFAMLALPVLCVGWLGSHFVAGVIVFWVARRAGHVLAARMLHVPVSWLAAVPVIGPGRLFRRAAPDAHLRAGIAAGGLVLGTCAALALWEASRVTGSLAVLAAAYAGFAFSSIQLLPVRFLDGGRMSRAIALPLVWVALALLVLSFILRGVQNPVLWLLVIAWVPVTVRGTPVGWPAASRWNPASKRRALVWGMVYAVLCAVVLWSSRQTFDALGGMQARSVLGPPPTAAPPVPMPHSSLSRDPAPEPGLAQAR